MYAYYLNLRSRLFRAMEFYGKCHKSHKIHTSVEIKNATSVSIQFRVLTFSGNKYVDTAYICLATMDQHRMDHRCQKSKQKLDEVLKQNCILLPKGRPCVILWNHKVVFEKRYACVFNFWNVLYIFFSNLRIPKNDNIFFFLTRIYVYY